MILFVSSCNLLIRLSWLDEPESISGAILNRLARWQFGSFTPQPITSQRLVRSITFPIQIPGYSLVVGYHLAE